MKTKELYVMGIDCGSLSARVVISRISDGVIVSSCAGEYPHGILSGQLPDGTGLPEGMFLYMAEDYIELLPRIIGEAMGQSGITPEQIVGVGVDATSCTIVPCTENGTPLSLLPENRKNPNAYIKSWKYHDVQEQADRIEETARACEEQILENYGGTISCEFMLPKVMKIYEEDPEIFRETIYYVDLCDWLTWKMTGTLTRSSNAAGFKNLWSREKGYPSEEFLDGLYEGFGRQYAQKVYSGKIYMPGECCGRVNAEGVRWLGLQAETAVSAGMMDGHASAVSLGLGKSGEMGIIIGTSNGIPFISKKLSRMKGVLGVVKDGIIPGFYGYAAGQIATGDMLSWFVKNQVPAEYLQEAEEKNCSIHALLCEKAGACGPEHNSLTVLDWWNGNRSILCNQQLTGIIQGLTLETKPEEIYCGMLQGIACGTRIILEHSHKNGVEISDIYACGGIPSKNPFFMQQYANILNRDIQVASEANSSALGSAICAAAAVGTEKGGYESLQHAMEQMRIRNVTTYRPQKEYTEQYERIYQRYHELYILLGTREKQEK